MTLDAWMIWAGVAVLLGLAELSVPGVFLAFLALSAAITALLSGLFPGLGLGLQLVSFAAWAIVTVLIGRRWYRDFPVVSADPMLNDRAARMIGCDAVVADPIVQGSGRVRIGDSEWPARGPDAATGERMRVVRVTGGVVEVEARDGGGAQG